MRSLATTAVVLGRAHGRSFNKLTFDIGAVLCGGITVCKTLKKFTPHAHFSRVSRRHSVFVVISMQLRFGRRSREWDIGIGDVTSCGLCSHKELSGTYTGYTNEPLVTICATLFSCGNVCGTKRTSEPTQNTRVIEFDGVVPIFGMIR